MHEVDDRPLVSQFLHFLWQEQRPCLFRAGGTGRRLFAVAPSQWSARAGRDRVGRIGAEHLGIVLRISLFARRKQDLAGVVRDEGAGVLFPINRFELREALNDREQTQIVAGHEADGLGQNVDPPEGRELIQDHEALVPQAGIRRGQVDRVVLNQLGEEQVDQQRRVAESIGRNADIDRHPLRAHLFHVEVRRTRRRIDNGITEDGEGGRQGCENPRHGILAGRAEPVQGRCTVVAQRGVTLGPGADEVLQIVLDGLTLAGCLPEHFPETTE